MDCETNIDSIRVLDEQIREHERAAIKLRRARNSLLNISKLPPELLGKIFHWNVALKDDFGGLDKRSHNFLLVCHHWFEVASHTPELWSFWGNTPRDWARRYPRSGTAPLDLVLDQKGCKRSPLDTTLCSVLQDRATRDAIRRVHLAAKNFDLLSSIIAQLTANCEELRSSGIESFILWNWSGTPVDVSDFFALHRFPKLRCIRLENCTVSSWDHLTSRTSVLTTLELDFDHNSPTPTTPQLLSILASNPVLRRIALFGCIVPGGGDEPSFRAQLHHLKELVLEGDVRYVVGFLRQLDHPRNINELSLSLLDCDVADVSQIIGPYLRDHLQGRDRPQDWLDLSVSSYYYTYQASHIILHVGDANGIHFSVPPQERIGAFATITVVLPDGTLRRDVMERAALDLISYAPRVGAVNIQARNIYDPVTTEATYAQFPNLRALSFHMVSLTAVLPESTLLGDGKMFPSLEHISLGRLTLDDGDWSPLTTFLGRRMSSGNRLDTLEIACSPHMCQEVTKDIGAMVRELKDNRPDLSCPYGTCLL